MIAPVTAEDMRLQLREYVGDTGLATELVITNQSDQELTHGWRLYFSFGLQPVAEENRLDRIILDGRYGYLTPNENWKALTPGGSVTIQLVDWLFQGMKLKSKQGFHLSVLPPGQNEEVLLGVPEQLPAELLPMRGPAFRGIEKSSPSSDKAAQTPRHVYETNLSSQFASETTIIPALKHQLKLGGSIVLCSVDISAVAELENEATYLGRMLFDLGVLQNTGEADDFPIKLRLDKALMEVYELEVNEDEVQIVGGSTCAVFQGIQTLRQLIQVSEEGATPELDLVQIRDYPDFEHRAYFLDIARHFQSPAQIKKLITGMAAYKLNRLQLGISNDEAWRLQVNEFPQLTDIGSRRSFYVHDQQGNREALYPAWGDDHQTHEGYLSQSELQDIIRFAAQHHVEIVLEFNLPGHANAIIVAMQGSESYQLVDPADQSQHRSAQGFTRNVVNVCLPSTYGFVKAVLQEIKNIYQAAGVPLQRMHFGGDETPDGAWIHSPICRNSSIWDQRWSMDNSVDIKAARKALMSHHYQQLQQVVREVVPDLIMGFWHEMSPYTDLQDDGKSYFNAWTTEASDRDIVDGMLERQQPLVISNASFLYFDMPYGREGDEPGLPWAAYVDTRHVYHFDPLDNWEITIRQAENVLGLQAQLWGETVYSGALADYYTFPRLLALAERCWTAKPAPENWLSFAAALGQRELAYLDSLDIQYRIPTPGAIVKAGELLANVVFPGLIIRYTLDGTEPDQRSAIYSDPVTLSPGQTPSLAVFAPNGRRSRMIQLETQ